MNHSPSLRLHSLNEIRERLPEVLGLLSPETLDQLVGDIGRALHLWQQVIEEEIDGFLTSGLKGVSQQHCDLEQHLLVSHPSRGLGGERE